MIIQGLLSGSNWMSSAPLRLVAARDASAGIGWVLTLLPIPVFIPLIRAEEALLLSAFGEGYASYRRRSWLPLPVLF
jgi:protein-S-isoprenylcysteine O-methyltransferase Ste14